MAAEVPGRIVRTPEPHIRCSKAGCMEYAKWRLTTEVDSSGAEHEHYCNTHMDEIRKELRKADHSGTCEVCGGFDEDIRPIRDFTEGNNGPVYDACPSCRKTIRESAY